MTTQTRANFSRSCSALRIASSRRSRLRLNHLATSHSILLISGHQPERPRTGDLLRRFRAEQRGPVVSISGEGFWTLETAIEAVRAAPSTTSASLRHRRRREADCGARTRAGHARPIPQRRCLSRSCWPPHQAHGGDARVYKQVAHAADLSAPKDRWRKRCRKELVGCMSHSRAWRAAR